MSVVFLLVGFDCIEVGLTGKKGCGEGDADHFEYFEMGLGICRYIRVY